jgi:hypothetical protein
MHRFIVITPWVSNYPNPIHLLPGDRVIVDHGRIEENPEWQGWLWCTVNDASGWVPQQILRAENPENGEYSEIAEYSANELSAQLGEHVLGDQILIGWIWGESLESGKTGWIPLDHLRPETQGF